MSDGNPHNHEQRIKNPVETVKKPSKISQRNTEVILDFKKYLEGQNLSKDRIFSLPVKFEEVM